MSSAAAVDAGVLEDAQNWHRRLSSKVPSYWVYTKPIQKSQQDDREYRLIRLDNGLQAMLVHDAKADKAAASLDVAVGHLHDPVDMPGLAHFCEHLLFMGTEQFPKENEYSEFLSRNNGSSNAFTAPTNTNYYFSVATSALAGALERFSGFFHSPLFAPSGTIRELNAVDSEYKTNLQNDKRRVYQLNKHLTKPGHVWSQFGTGNKVSLTSAARKITEDGAKKKDTDGSGSMQDTSIQSSSPLPLSSPSTPSPESGDDGGPIARETRRRLVEWWSREYCAGRMRLCIVGKDPLDNLVDLAADLFSLIPNRGQISLPSIPDHPFGPDEKGTLVSVQTIKDFQAMEISFPIDEQTSQWRFKPGSYLASIIGHEGPGSLHSYLKERGWIVALTTDAQDLARGFATFEITLDLSQNGFQNYRQVEMATFNYISMLRSTDLSPTYQMEVSALSNIHFRFLEKDRPEDYAVWVADKLSWPVPRELVIKAPLVDSEWDHDGTAQAVAFHTLKRLSAKNSRTVLMARQEEFEKLFGTQQWETEPWYETQYRVERLDEAFIREADGPNTIDAFHLPRPNEFIPKRLDVDKREVSQVFFDWFPQPRPHLIYESSRTTLWHKKDDQFWVPKAHVVIEMRTPVADESPIASVLTELYTDIVTDALNEYSYDAELAGLEYSFGASSLGFYIAIAGYNDKLHVLLRDVLVKARDVEVRADRLDVIIEITKQDWENFFLGQSYRLSDYYGRYLMTEREWTILEKLQVLGSVTPAQVQQHKEALFSNLQARMLVVGNVYQDEAIALAKMTEEIIPASPLSGIGPVDLSLQLPEGTNHVWSSPVSNPNETNSALTYYVNFGSKVDRHLRVVSKLLTQILSEPAFDTLRTKEQLGYIVGADLWDAPGDNETGLHIVVQSERVPVYLEGRVEAFLDHMKSVIELMSDEQFAEQKHGLEGKWREVAKILDKEASRFWAQIDTGYLDFSRRVEDAEYLTTVTKQDVLSLFLSRVHPSSKTRSKLSIHAQSQKPPPKHVSRAAADAFAEVAREHGIDIDDVDWSTSLYADGEPAETQFSAFWKEALARAPTEKSDKVFAAVPHLLEHFPAQKDAQGSLREEVIHIKDIVEFRKSLKVSEYPKPLVAWNDLPTLKLEGLSV